MDENNQQVPITPVAEDTRQGPRVAQMHLGGQAQNASKSNFSKLIRFVHIFYILSASLLITVIGLGFVFEDNLSGFFAVLWAGNMLIVLTLAYVVARVIFWYTGRDARGGIEYADQRKDIRKAYIAGAVPIAQVLLLLIVLWKTFIGFVDGAEFVVSTLLSQLIIASSYVSILAVIYAWQIRRTPYRKVANAVFIFYGIFFMIGAIIGLLSS